MVSFVNPAYSKSESPFCFRNSDKPVQSSNVASFDIVSLAAVRLWITSFWDWGLRVESFWWGVVAALIISLINWVFGILLRPKTKD